MLMENVDETLTASLKVGPVCTVSLNRCQLHTGIPHCMHMQGTQAQLCICCLCFHVTQTTLFEAFICC